jgi:Ca2+-binding EF-hand superfamily protein
LKQLQEEFMRLDVDHKGTLTAEDIKKIADSDFG